MWLVTGERSTRLPGINSRNVFRELRRQCRYPSNPDLQKVIVTDAAQGKKLADGTVEGGGLGGFCCQIDAKTGML
eukprot:SAG11_NODE_680_length_7781_cov_6.490497_9_plen_75_part_00